MTGACNVQRVLPVRNFNSTQDVILHHCWNDAKGTTPLANHALAASAAYIYYLLVHSTQCILQFAMFIRQTHLKSMEERLVPWLSSLRGMGMVKPLGESVDIPSF